MALLNISLEFSLRIPQIDNHGFPHSEMKVFLFSLIWRNKNKEDGLTEVNQEEKDKGAEEGGSAQGEES